MGVCTSSPRDIDYSYFRIGQELGKGGFGKVHIALRNDEKRKTNYDSTSYLAIKRISKARLLGIDKNNRSPDDNNRNTIIEADKTAAMMLWMERAVMITMRSPYTVRLQHAFQTPEEQILVMPCYMGGDIYSYQQNHDKIDENAVRFYAAEQLEGIAHIHSRHFVFRDIKPLNQQIGADGHLAITDFGLCRLQEEENDYYIIGRGGTRGYRSPEAAAGYPYDFSCDFFSFGVTLYEMATGRRKVQSLQPNVPQSSNDVKANSNLSSEFKDLIRRLTVTNPTERIGCELSCKRMIERCRRIGNDIHDLNSLVKNYRNIMQIGGGNLSTSMMISTTINSNSSNTNTNSNNTNNYIMPYDMYNKSLSGPLNTTNNLSLTNQRSLLNSSSKNLHQYTNQQISGVGDQRTGNVIDEIDIDENIINRKSMNPPTLLGTPSFTSNHHTQRILSYQMRPGGQVDEKYLYYQQQQGNYQVGNPKQLSYSNTNMNMMNYNDWSAQSGNYAQYQMASNTNGRGAPTTFDRSNLPLDGWYYKSQKEIDENDNFHWNAIRRHPWFASINWEELRTKSQKPPYIPNYDPKEFFYNKFEANQPPNISEEVQKQPHQTPRQQELFYDFEYNVNVTDPVDQNGPPLPPSQMEMMFRSISTAQANNDRNRASVSKSLSSLSPSTYTTSYYDYQHLAVGGGGINGVGVNSKPVGCQPTNSLSIKGASARIPSNATGASTSQVTGGKVPGSIQEDDPENSHAINSPSTRKLRAHIPYQNASLDTNGKMPRHPPI